MLTNLGQVLIITGEVKILHPATNTVAAPNNQHIQYLMNHPFKGIEAVDNKEEDDPIYDSN